MTPARLYLIHLRSVEVQRPGGLLLMSMGCYLVQTDDGRNVLIDSGLPPEMTTGGPEPSEQSPPLLDQLRGLGVEPGDVGTLVSTHLDIDHVGHHELFSNAEHVVQRRQMDVARGGDERFAGGRAHWDTPLLRRRLIDGDYDLFPGLRLIETSGHAPGHQSVLVRLPRTGPVLLAADAVSLERLFTSDRPAQPTEDAEELRASTRKLLDLVDTEGVALTIFHHDGTQWRSLKRAPAFYD
jgi:N-acyl homoserine lactone hydrolase